MKNCLYIVHIRTHYLMFASHAQSTTMRSKKKEGSLKPSRKLDRRSSRGVMFENEELRLRTIEINAEVEQGQSDLRKLKKENETLKQQVWTLRDEYDKLETYMKKIGKSTDDADDDDEDDDDDDDDSIKSDCDDDAGSQKRRSSQCPDLLEVEDSQDMSQKSYAGKVHAVKYSLCQAAGVSKGETSCLGTFQPVDCHSKSISTPSSSGQSFLTHDNSVLATANPNVKPHLSKDNSSTSDTFLSQTDHFNLDQLLDFASSFHYDRRQHLTDDEPTVTVTLPSDEERIPSPVDESELREEDDSFNGSGFSTVRRKSTSVIEKLKETANSETVVKEVQQVSISNGNKDTTPLSDRSDMTAQTTTVTYSRSSYYFAGSLDNGRSQSLGAGLNSTTAAKTPPSPITPLFSSTSATNIASSTSSIETGLPLVSLFPHRAPSLVRLNTIEPNTLMISFAEMPQLWDITTQEIIDELEQQLEPSFSDIRGVRVTGRAAYISMGRREPLQQLQTSGLTIRGISVSLIDITRESIVVALAGVPHYVADSTLTILLSAFGVIIGEIERRFYKGVDTGERFVRMKLKRHVKLPKYVTVGGCRIVLGIHGSEQRVPKLNDWVHHPSGHSQSFHSVTPPPPPHRETIKSRLQSPLEIPHCKEVCADNVLCDKRDSCSNIKSSIRRPLERRDSTKSGKTFSSRCVVNLKPPERSNSTDCMPLVAHREAPLPPCSGSSCVSGDGGGGIAIGIAGAPTITPLSAGHVLQASTLDHRKSSDTSSASVKLGSNPPSVSRKTTRFFSLHESSKPRSASILFSGKRREGLRPVPPPQLPLGAGGPPPLANGILRKASVSEQEALIPPKHQSATATIRNRLKIGRSVSYDSNKKKAQLGRMESISENTINEDTSDITPLGASRPKRRDSDKSSLSANSKGSNNKAKKEVIDLPWCGCWGNGCF